MHRGVVTFPSYILFFPSLSCCTMMPSIIIFVLSFALFFLSVYSFGKQLSSLNNVNQFMWHRFSLLMTRRVNNVLCITTIIIPVIWGWTFGSNFLYLFMSKGKSLQIKSACVLLLTFKYWVFLVFTVLLEFNFWLALHQIYLWPMLAYGW